MVNDNPINNFLSPDDVDQFKLITRIPRDSIGPLIENNISNYDEDTEMEAFLREIICDTDATDHNSMEIADILTWQLSIKGIKTVAAFVNKGKSYKTVRGSDVAAQLNKAEQRVAGIGLLVFAAVGNKIIDEAKEHFCHVVKRNNIKGLFLDRKDLARLFIAYRKACPQDGYPLKNGKCPHCRREVRHSIDLVFNIDLGNTNTIQKYVNKENSVIPLSVGTVIKSLESEIVGEKAKRWFKEIEELRTELNRGLKTKVLPRLRILLAEVEKEQDGGNIIDLKPIGKIYRIAASALLPLEAGLCEEFESTLSKAIVLVDGEELEECRILEAAYRAYQMNDADGAVNILDNCTIDKARRVKFNILLHFKSLADCDDMLTAGIIDPTLIKQSVEWAEVFASYYLKKEQFKEIPLIIEELVRDKNNLQRLSHAAFLLHECGLGHLSAFYKKFNIPDKINVKWLPLHDFKDYSLLERSARLAWEVSEAYKKHDCLNEEKRAIEMALNFAQSVLEDRGPTFLPEVSLWRQRLQEIVANQTKDTVTDILLHVGDPNPINLTVNNIRERFNDKNILPESILFLIETCTFSSVADYQEMASLLESCRDRFTSNIANYTLFTWSCSDLWGKGGRDDLALGVLESFVPDAPYGYLRELNLALFEFQRKNLHRAEKYIDSCLLNAPDNPAVLGFLLVILSKKLELTKQDLEESKRLQNRQLEITKKLFQLLPIKTLFLRYLDLLYKNDEFDEIISVIADPQNPKISEEEYSRIKYHTLMALYRYDLALTPLQILCEKCSSKIDGDWVNLSIVYRVLGNLTDAIHALEKAIELNASNLNSRRLLTQMLLGIDKEKAYANALRTSLLYPDSEETLATLVFTAFETGHELDSEVRTAFQQFQPGGKFPNSKIIWRMDEADFLKRFVEERRQNLTSIDEIYKKGAMPLLFISSFPTVNKPFFKLHKEMKRAGSKRYFAAGEQYVDGGWIFQIEVDALVMDYHALVTIWELFGVSAFDLLGKRLKKLFMPDSFLALLALEEDQLTGRGQPREEEKRRSLLDALHREIGKKVTVHEGIKPENGFDVIGHYTEQAIAKEKKLPYLSAFETNIIPEVVVFGFKRVAEFLEQKSLLDNKQISFLKKMEDHRVIETMNVSWGNDIVIELTTMLSILEVISVEDFFAFFTYIHISQPALDYLRAEVEYQQFVESIETDMKQFRSWIDEGLKRGLLELVSLSNENRSIKIKNRTDQQERDLESQYYFDLLNVAGHKRVPLWTDDFATRRLGAVENHHILSTDVFLSWMNLATRQGRFEQHLNDNDYCKLSVKLMDMGYFCMAVNVKLIVLLLNKNPNLEKNRTLERLFKYYREGLSEVYSKIQGSDAVIHDIKIRVYDSKLGQKVTHFYNDSIFDFLRISYKLRLKDEILDHVFKKIYFLSTFPNAQENALLWLSSLLVRFTSLVPPESQTDTPIFIKVRDAVYSFTMYLDELLLRCGIEEDLIDRAWMGLIDMYINSVSETKTDLDRLVHLNLIVYHLACCPDRVLSRIPSSPLGLKLKTLGIELHDKDNNSEN